VSPLFARVRLTVEVLRCFARVRRDYWKPARHDLRGAMALLRENEGRRAHYAMPALSDQEAIRLGYAVSRVVALMPGESRCLMRSMVLSCMLERRGVGSTVVIGVVPGADFTAHAWVEREGLALLPRQRAAAGRLVQI
jgi:hypothetical protein